MNTKKDDTQQDPEADKAAADKAVADGKSGAGKDKAPPSDPDTTEAPKLTKIELIKRHMHDGIVYAEKEIIQVAESIVVWFEGEGIAKRYTGDKPAKNAKE